MFNYQRVTHKKKKIHALDSILFCHLIFFNLNLLKHMKFCYWSHHLSWPEHLTLNFFPQKSVTHRWDFFVSRTLSNVLWVSLTLKPESWVPDTEYTFIFFKHISCVTASELKHSPRNQKWIHQRVSYPVFSDPYRDHKNV